MIKSELFFLFMSFSIQVTAQVHPEIEWFREYPVENGNGYSLTIQSTFHDNMGNFYIGATAHKNYRPNYKIIKYNKNGELVLNIDGPTDTSFTSFGSRICTDSVENIFIGYIKKIWADPIPFNIVLKKYSPDGIEVWMREYSGSDPVRILLDNNENLYFGYTGRGGNSVIIKKFLMDGTLVWSQEYTDVGGLHSLYDHNSEIYFTSFVTIPGTDPPESIGSIYKINSEGEIIWSYSVISTPICFDRNSNIIFTKVDGSIVKINNHGDIQWTNSVQTFWTREIKVDENNDIVIIGSQSDLEGITARNYMTKKISKDGDFKWVREFNSIETQYSRDHALDLIIDSKNSIIVTGRSERGEKYCYTIKYNDEGQEIYQFKMEYKGKTSFEGRKICSIDKDSYCIIGTADKTIFLAKILEKTGLNSIQHSTKNLDFSLSQNRPNPFNAVTAISYYLPVKSNVKLSIFDMGVREIVVLVNREQSQGEYQINFDAEGLNSGVYIVRLLSNGVSVSRKMLLLK